MGKADKDVRAVMIQDGRVFLVRRLEYYDFWELPGGHPSAGHDDINFLRTRVLEWFNGTKLKDDFKYYRDFRGRHGGRQYLKSDVYFMNFDGSVNGLRKANWKMAWMTYDERGKYKVAELTEGIIEGLHKDRRI